MKKMVRHVPADGSSSDVWAWRKYGQKPIKGSPYPRSAELLPPFLLAPERLAVASEQTHLTGCSVS